MTKVLINISSLISVLCAGGAALLQYTAYNLEKTMSQGSDQELISKISVAAEKIVGQSWQLAAVAAGFAIIAAFLKIFDN